ncbi:fungal specific transcription factor [Botrytis cinerea]
MSGTSGTSTDKQPQSQPGQAQSSQETPLSPNQSSPDLEPAEDLHAPSSQPRPAPLQKRRRVTRACDEYCTYDQPSNRRRNPAPQYVESLELRLQRAESIIKAYLPNINLNDPNIDAASLLHRQVAPTTPSTTSSLPSGTPQQPQLSEQDAQLRSMIESTGQLDLDERGNWDFHGGSSGTVFIRRLREQFGSLLGSPNLLPKPPSAQMPPTFDSPRSSTDSPYDFGLPNTMDLPPREVAMSLCEDALHCACCLLRFVHEPSFYEMFNRIYDLPPESFGDEEHKFLPLLYMALALGSARQMMDLTDCRDMTSLQTIIFMIMFLQATSNLSICYSYIGLALRSSLRIGLHRSLSGNFNPIERETRKRVFWLIRKLDTYVSAILGFPIMLSSDDIDQDMPLEVDDEYITKDAILPMPPGKMSLLVASNAHTRLMGITSKVVKHIYPIKGLEQSISGNSKASYTISHSKIREIEKDLADWLDMLPMGLRPGGEGTPELIRIQQLLRLAYAHVQMMLYRPFLHYVSGKGCAGKTIDERSYACAAACVSVARNIIHITAGMKKQGLLVGAYWFTMYTTFFSVISLVYYVLENPDKSGAAEILADANDGKDALIGLAQRSMAADRCSETLKPLFEQLPEKLKNRSVSAPSKKKRSAPSSTQPTHHSSPEIPRPSSSHFTPGLPMQNLNNRFHINTASNPNLRQGFQDLVSPSDLSTAGTPESTASTTHSIPQYGVQNQFNANNSIPYLTGLMFPSTDPFAYPNQPMMEFDAQVMKQENDVDDTRTQQMYMGGGGGAGTGNGMFDDLEGQIFGPLPPYMMQAQHGFDMSGAGSGSGNVGVGGGSMGGMMHGTNANTNTSGAGGTGFNPQNLVYNTGMNLDGIFDNVGAIRGEQGVGGVEWEVKGLGKKGVWMKFVG